ncbi:7313_t:CDS:2, partial [Paraglomus occultum]
NEITEQFEVEPTGVDGGDQFDEWILSTGKNICPVRTLTEVKEFFTDEEWCEMISGFSKTVTFHDINEQEEKLLYNLLDNIEKKPNDLVTEIEKCIIEGFPKTNVIRRLIQTYVYNLERLAAQPRRLSSAAIHEHDDKRYSDLSAKAEEEPTDKSLIGQKCDFRVTLMGLKPLLDRSGGLPEACKAKKWDDKVDLMVAMRDVMLKEAIECNGVNCQDFKRIYTLGVHSYGFYYNVYAMDWRAKGLWRLGLLKKIKLPQSNGQLLMIEKLVTTLLRIEYPERFGMQFVKKGVYDEFVLY